MKSCRWFVCGYVFVACVLTVFADSCPKLNKQCDCSNHTNTIDPIDLELFCSQPKYYAPPTFPKFIVHPKSTVIDPTSLSRVTFTCSITLVDEFNSIEWEHDGVPVNISSEEYHVQSHNETVLIHSSLQILSPDLNKTEGAYRCRVDYLHGNFTVLSTEAHFEQPYFYGWVDSSSDSSSQPHYSTSNVVSLTVSAGRSFVLECSPSTNYPPDTNISVEWTRNGKLIQPSGSSIDDDLIVLKYDNSLLVRNFSALDNSGGDPSVVGDGEVNVTFECSVSGLNYSSEVRRTFVVATSRGDIEESQMDLFPLNKTVLPGADVVLYCLSSSSSSLPTNTTWLYGNSTVPLLDSDNNGDYLILGEVLVIRNVTKDVEGWYSCVEATGESHTAHVYVIDVVTITSSTHGVADGKIDLATDLSESSLNLTASAVSLSCDTGTSSNLWNASGNLQVTWFFRGKPVNSNSAQTMSNVVFVNQDNSLTMMSYDPWQLIGSIECFVSISSPTGVQFKIASVHIFAEGKPNPPRSIEEHPSPSEYFTRAYMVISTGSDLGYKSLYDIIIFSDNNEDYTRCMCHSTLSDSYHQTWLYFKTANWISEEEKSLYVRAATDVNGVDSDFLPYHPVDQPSQNLCASRLIIDRAPPKPRFNYDATPTLLPDLHLWSVTESWYVIPADNECHYPTSLYSSNITLSCPNQVHTEQVYDSEYSFNMSCRMTCNLTVTFYTNNYKNQSTTAITTDAIVPSVPPFVNLTERVNESVFNVVVTLPDRHISCEPPFLMVNYSTFEGQSSLILLDIGSCNTTKSSSPSQPSYVCRIDTIDSCPVDYDVQVAYGYNETFVSDYSESVHLYGTNESDVLDGFGSLITNSISPREISVNLTFSDNVTCFVSRRLITAHACVSPPTENDCQTTKFNFLPQDCQKRKAVDGTEIIFGQLAPNTNYCFMVNVSYMNSHYLLEGSARTKRDSGQDPPIINHNGDQYTTDYPHSNNLDQTTFVIVIIAAVVAILTICFATCVIIFLCQRYKKKKSHSYYRRLNNQQDNDSITNQDLVSVGPGDRAESIISDGTDLTRLTPYLVGRLLRDSSREQDQPSLCDDHLSHQGELMEEDMERDEEGSSVSSAPDQVEVESNGSLEERQKMILTQIQRENEKSKKREEMVELSPITPTTPSTVVASPASAPITPNNNYNSPSARTPLSNGHYNYRLAHNSYVQQEGLHSLSSTPTLVRNVPSGYAPLPQIASWMMVNKTEPASNSYVSNGLSGSQLHHTQPQWPAIQQTPTTTPWTESVLSSSSPSVDGSQKTVTSDSIERRVLSDAHAISSSGSGGYVQSSFFGGQHALRGHMTQQGGYITQQGGHMTQQRSRMTQQGSHMTQQGSHMTQPSHEDGMNGNGSNLNSQFPLGADIPFNSSGYVCDPSSTNGQERESRGASTESGNEEDSTSYEGDANSVFDDELIHRGSSADHSVRARSTATSGFISGSSESASPEPPNKPSLSVSPPPSPPSSLSAVQFPDSSDLLSLSFGSGGDISSDSSLFVKRSSNPPPVVSSYATSMYTSHLTTSIPSQTRRGQDAVSGYHSSSTGSSGYMSNSSQSYHSSSAISQASRSAASDELYQEVDTDETAPSSKYTIPSLLPTRTKSSSIDASLTTALPKRATKDTSPQIRLNSTSCNTHHPPRPPYPHECVGLVGADAPRITDYVNTSDIELNKISTTFGPLSLPAGGAETTDYVSFGFPFESCEQSISV